jgi:hypothetical protein
MAWRLFVVILHGGAGISFGIDGIVGYGYFDRVGEHVSNDH